MKRRSFFVYGCLAAILVLLSGWQAVEHRRVEASARATLRNQAKDISNTLFLLMRSQRFFGVITKERLESALNEVVTPGVLRSVVLVNSMYEVVASAGKPMELPAPSEFKDGEVWTGDTVTLMNLVVLGSNLTQESTNLSIVLPANEFFGYSTNRSSGFRGTNEPRRGSEGDRLDDRSHDRPPMDRLPTEDPAFHAPMDVPFSQDAASGDRMDGPRRRRDNWRRGAGDSAAFVRPPWMKESDFQDIIKKKGVHGLLIAMSTQSLQPVLREDVLVRVVIVFLGTLTVFGAALTWRSLDKNAELQIRLVRAREQNLHLQQMNLAAAGLAHETRNPLNIIRGLAQLISKEQSASPEIRTHSRGILDETDRVTAQLNEFINYSRPREVRYSATGLNCVINEVARALNYDLEEKKARLVVACEPYTINSDEAMLRQALFNLVLNAVQAVEPNGEIRVDVRKTGAGEVAIEISDNGPGVSSENMEEIFKPYFTTHKKGTGLGLAIVRQIVLAHGWEIECKPNQPKGAVFRISHVKLKS
jgi:signal transduction histidine kinase